MPDGPAVSLDTVAADLGADLGRALAEASVQRQRADALERQLADARSVIDRLTTEETDDDRPDPDS